MSTSKTLLIAGGILVTGALVAFLLVSMRSEPPRQPPPPQTPLVQTAQIAVGGGALEVRGSGTVRPRAEVALAPQIAGRVVYVAPSLVSGGRVRQGETLVRIDPADYQNRVQQAQADVEQQRVTVRQAEEESRVARAEYERFQERQQRRAADPYAGIDADDYAARVVPSAASPTVFPADPPPGADGAPPDSARLALVFREPQRQAAQAALGRAEAALADAELALGRTSLTAPFAAVVRSETVDRGSYVAPGQALAQLYAADVLEVVVPLSQDEATLLPGLFQLRAGVADRRVPARVVATYGAARYAWDGYVDRAESALDETTRTINVVVRVPNPFRSGERVGGTDTTGSQQISEAPPLLVGSFVDVAFQGAQIEAYAVVPRRSLRRGNEVWTIEQDSLLRIVPVRVLQQTDSDVFIVADGLDPSQRIVTSDLQAVTDGMTVRLASAVRENAGPQTGDAGGGSAQN
ncbi:MAG: biotin/lipoyl-binding protein [Bacteroidota bacterium]